jgi:mannose-6-phosphate isomerase-like protein (cupin superfamily)
MEAHMRAIVVTLVLTITAIATLAVAQQPAAQAQAASAMKTFSSSADVTALIAKAKAERKEGQPTVIEHLLTLDPYNANLEYRASVGPAAIHEKEAEMMYVIDGSATIIIGGTLTEQKRTNPENLSGTGIEGGASKAVSKGDFIFVPENTAHWFNTINGVLILMTLHVPRPVPAAH